MSTAQLSVRLSGAVLAIVLVTSSVGCTMPNLRNKLVPNQPIPCELSSDPNAADPSAVAADSLVMDATAFWALIDLMEGETEDASFDALSDKLTELEIDDLVAFEARLTLSLYALDDPCRVEWYRLNEPAAFGFVSDDTFLYARCDTVAAGRTVWQEAIDTRTLPWGTVDPTTGNGEYLLYVASMAAETKGLDFGEFYDLVDQRIQVSYETGSNPAGWGT